MNDATFKLNFELPQRVKPQRDDRFGSNRLFMAWLDTVPLANTSASGNALLGALEELNESDVPAKFRIQILERMREPVITVVAALDKLYSDTSFPISDKAEQVGRVSVHFFEAFAKAYRIAADQLSNSSGKVNIINAKQAALCVHRSLSSLEQCFLRICLLYRQPDPMMWTEANRLYGFCKQNKLLDKKFADGFRLGSPVSTVRYAYHRILLMAISDPSRLSQRANKLLFEACLLWSERAQINRELKIGAFLLGGQTGNPPELITDTTQVDANAEYFDVGPLKVWLNVQLSNSENDDVVRFDSAKKSVIVEQTFIKQFINNWGQLQQRSFERLQATHQIKLVVGLNAMHYLACDNMDFERFLQESGDHKFVDAVSATNSWGGESEANRRPTVFDAGVLNQSLGGYRLNLESSPQLQLRVGELIGLCPAALVDEEPIWMLAIIRWLHFDEEKALQIGVRIIGRSVKPAGLLPNVGQGDSKMPPFRGMVVTPFDTAWQATDFLVVPGFFNRSDEALKIYFSDELESFSGEVMLDELIEKTTEVSSYAFDRFKQTL